MKKQYFTLLALLVITISSCNKDKNTTQGNSNSGTNNNTDFVIGKNLFVTKIDGDSRKYYVHVPKSYNGQTAVPMVLMLHGTNGDGEKFYNISGWKEVGETENIITVFPSSWHYCINDQGEIKNTTKWNVSPDCEWAFCSGETPRNDIRFLSTIITELNAKFKIDNKRIYLAGFSNGGQMAAKCAIEMSDKFAAIAENAGSFYLDTTYIPKRKLPTLFQIGNEDYGPGNTGPAVPLSVLDSILKTSGLPYIGGRINRIANNHIKDFLLNPNYTITGDTNTVVISLYKSLTSGSNTDFRLSFVKGLGHQYPNGSNHWMYAAKVQWEWFKQYTLP